MSDPEAALPLKQPQEYSQWDPRSAPATYFLLLVNLAVFAWMSTHGVPVRGTPGIDQLLYFGANNSVLVVQQGQWYRLVTATFVHIGVVHLAGNLWCLWNLGLVGEPLIGPLGLLATYLITGVAGNLLSIAWDVGVSHYYRLPLDAVSSVGAGASGAIFGITGLFIILLSNRKLPIPWSELKRLRSSVVLFAAVSLITGGATLLPAFIPALGHLIQVRVDNTAHVGGFLSGLALGPGLVPRMTAGRAAYLGRQRVVFTTAAFALTLAGYWIVKFQ